MTDGSEKWEKPKREPERETYIVEKHGHGETGQTAEWFFRRGGGRAGEVKAEGRTGRTGGNSAGNVQCGFFNFKEIVSSLEQDLSTVDVLRAWRRMFRRKAKQIQTIGDEMPALEDEVASGTATPQ